MSWVKVFCTVSLLLMLSLLLFVLGQSYFGSNRWNPDGEWILFTCTPTDRHKYSDVYLVGSDGTNLYSLKPNFSVIPSDYRSASWSPNQTSILFIKDFGNHSEMIQLRLSDQHIETLVSGYPQHAPAWSSDGDKIAFTQDFYLYVLELSSGTINRLSQQRPVFSPIWSPDSEYILFTIGELDHGEIHVIATDGNERMLTRTKTPLPNPQWSPNSKIIVFIDATENGEINLYLLDIENRERKQLTQGFQWLGSPVWSSDGQWIAFIGRKDAESIQIFKVNAGGSEAQQLTDTGFDTYNPIFSADDQWISFSGGNPNTLYKMKVDGSNLQMVVEMPECTINNSSWYQRLSN